MSNGPVSFETTKGISDNRGSKGSSTFVFQESFNRLTTLRNLGRSPQLAIVSTTPPANTSTANCTIETYRYSEFDVDIYSSFLTNFDYLSTVYAKEIGKSHAEIYALDTLQYGNSINEYQAVVFTLGDSLHSLPYMLSLLNIAKSSRRIRIYIYLNDPVVFNLLRITCEATGRNFVQEIKKTYGKLTASEWLRVESCDYSLLTECGITGISALFKDVAIETFIVNSLAAEEFLRSDSINSRDHASSFSVERIFHPIFPPSPSLPVTTAKPKHIRIGTFGIPNTGKRTELVIEAFTLIKNIIPDAELLIAGYNVDQYAAQSNLNSIKGIIILDSPNDSFLQHAMRSCHVGIQLRQTDHGKSSGIVSQLLANRVPVLVSQIGAFLEYGDAVGYVPLNADARQLSELILAELHSRNKRDEAISRVVKDHDPELFCRKLLAITAPAPLRLVVEPPREEKRIL